MPPRLFSRIRAAHKALLAVALVAAVVTLGSYFAVAQDTTTAAPEPLPSPTYVGSDMCLSCHEGQARGFVRTVHAKVPWVQPEAPAVETPAAETPAAEPSTAETPATETPATAETPAADAAAPAAEETPAAAAEAPAPAETPAETAAVEETPAPAAEEAPAAATEETPAPAPEETTEPEPVPVMPEGAMSCETCHGPGSNHVEAGGGEVGILSPEKAAPLTANATCLKCHEGQTHTSDYRFSRHGTSGVACYECHNAHPAKKKDVFPKMLSNNETEVCYNCHREQEAQANWPSHHPIREGRTLCSDCHNVHGSGLTKYRNAPSSRELCLSCHTQYRGPFIRDHAPVADDCMQCHKPHGAVEDNLLKVSEPLLCMRCHVTAHNPHRDATLLGPSELQNTVLFFSRCSLCHQQVHGSDLGPSLTR